MKEKKITRNPDGTIIKAEGVGIPFEPGNNVAQKWTVETVRPILENILATLSEGKEDQNGNLVRANDIKLAGEVRLMHGVTKQRWNEWKQKFSDSPEVSDLMEVISEILECRLLYSGTRMDEVILKNHYDYKDARQTEVTGNTTTGLTVRVIRDEHI